MRFRLYLLFIIVSVINLIWFKFVVAKEVCFKCHKVEKFKGKLVHSPVAKKDCEACHTPHVSKFNKLLIAKVPDICYQCHPEFLKNMQKAEWVHSPVEKGECLKCHQPHAGYRGLLKKSEKEQCLTCHKKLKKESFKFIHKPFKEGKCHICHNPHFSQNPYLLKFKEETICLNCHKLEKIKSTHRYYSKNMECLSCHNPHGSNNEYLIKQYMHKPYAQKNCKVCHENLAKGSDMCFSCHSEVKKDFFKVHTHYLPSNKKAFCLDCHSPHTSDYKTLLKGSPSSVCFKCHPEALKQQRDSLYVHPSHDQCLNCHNAHGSETLGMLKGTQISTCGRCHKRHVKFTHPIEKVKDPRNGQTLTCITCHDPMGTNFKNNLRLNGDKELCLECHKGY